MAPASPEMSPIAQALITLLAGGLLATLLARVLKTLFTPITRRSASQSDDFVLQTVVDTLPPLGWVISGVVAWRLLPMRLDADWAVLAGAKLVVTVLLVRLINRIGGRLLQSWAGRSSDSAIASMLRSLTPLLRAVIWVLGATLYLQNIGVQMAAIWALLSAGGIGAGLALKEPVAEFFEYITILLDKPFSNGQQIQVNGITATVERVGVRSTRLRSVNGEAIVMSNSALTGAVIANFGDMQQRRLLVRLGVSYDTDAKTLERLSGLLKNLVEACPGARFGRCHFVAFAERSLEFELVYFVDSADYEQALDAQQQVNLAIVRRFGEEGIRFAHPTLQPTLKAD